jgi:hypothetical protein
MELNSSWPGVHEPKLWSRRRHRGVDRRTRSFKAWARHRARLVAAMTHKPTTAEEAILDVLADRLVTADIRRAEIATGIAPEEPKAGTGEIRRLMGVLGLLGDKGEGDQAGTLSNLMNGEQR